jgi:simple sugar transport system ATP-binding protein
VKNKALVEMRKIHKWFGSVRALEDVYFTVGRNEVVGLVGDNGAGKSTLIKILSGVYPPDEGEIYFEDKKVQFSSPRNAMKAGIETIYQQTALVDVMNVMRNVFMGREPVRRIGPIGWLKIKNMTQESAKALEKVDLHLRSSSTLVGELSGGQRQGVAIARAMYFKTKLLILDEPTNNLSVKESRKVLQFIEDLKNQNVSSIFITHNLYHVYPVADRITILAHGKKIGEFTEDKPSIEELIKVMISN